METQALALEYPNGRVHECELTFAHKLTLGREFELHGRRWRVQHMLPADRGHPEPRLLCTSVGAGIIHSPAA
jgi:hypothetical protein